MDKQYEFKVVGTDENGNPLYQKVYQEKADDTKKVPGRKTSKDRAVNDGPNDLLYKEMDPEVVKLKHDESVDDYSEISFRDKEFVIKTISRHPIGLYAIWASAGIVSLIVIIAWIFIFNSFDSIFGRMSDSQMSMAFNSTTLILELPISIPKKLLFDSPNRPISFLQFFS